MDPIGKKYYTLSPQSHQPYLITTLPLPLSLMPHTTIIIYRQARLGINHVISTQRQRRHASTADVRSGSTYSYGCPYRSFAKDHPAVARRVLEVPPIVLKTSSRSYHYNHETEYETLEQYLKWRGWNVEGVLSEHNVVIDELDSAVGLLSHPLTFPLTLGRHCSAFVSSAKQEDNSSAISYLKPRLCVVGARAECTLPDDYWKEFLIISNEIMQSTSAHAIQESGNNNSGRRDRTHRWTIDFVGPDVQHNLKSKTISLSSDDEQCIQSTLSMNYHKKFLHEVVLDILKSSGATTNDNNKSDIQFSPDATNSKSKKIQQYWDGFILFNPGLGHPNLAKLWRPTLKFLMRTGRPVLFTAHSSIDAKRDLIVIEEMLMDEKDRAIGVSDIGYGANPFSSRMEFIDPCTNTRSGDDGSLVHVVRPNHSCFLLQ